MPYIGKQPVIGEFVELDALTASATADYTLTRNSVAYYPETVNNLLVSINGVIQAGSTMSLSGNTLTVGATLSSSDVIDFVRVFGNVGNVVTPTDGSVTDIKIDSMSASKLTGALPASSFPSGAIIQVQSFDKLDDQIIIGTSFDDVMSVSITPTSTTSKILVKCDINISASTASNGTTGARYSAVKLYRDSTQIGLNTSVLSSQSQVWFSCNSVQGTNSGYTQMNSSGSFMDAPATTSAITYKIQAGNTHGTSIYTYINRAPVNTDGALIHRGISNITVMEIAQ